MFGVFGLVGLIVFIYLKPQEFIPALERLPFLYLFLALTVFGLALDLRAKHIRLEKGPHLPYMVAFFLWCMITAFAKTGGSGLTPSIIQLSIALTLYVLVSTAVQTFKVENSDAQPVAVEALAGNSLAPLRPVLKKTGTAWALVAITASKAEAAMEILSMKTP